MKIILSRKGFDSSYGGVASPILPNGDMVSLPIPQGSGASQTYGRIKAGRWSVGQLVHDLTKRRLTANAGTHFDPDLARSSIPRLRGWRPTFGQASRAQTHLQNKNVRPGDVFVFFGWFREVMLNALGHYQYKPRTPNLHVCFGWLQIGQVLPTSPLAGLPKWAAGHPHYKKTPYSQPDCVYIARRQLSLPKLATPLPGGGVLRQYHRKRCLTEVGQTRRFWELPPWFLPTPPKPPLSYHSAADFHLLPNGNVRLQTVCIGQEFVLDCDYYPQAIPWLANLLT